MEYWCNWVCVDVRVLRWRGLLNMTHYFDVIRLLQAFRSWRQRTIPTVQHMKQAMMQSVAESSKYMQNSLFSLDSTMPWLSWVSCLDKKTEYCWRQPRKHTQKKLDDDAFLLNERRLCRLKRSLPPYNLPLSKRTNYSQWRLLISYSLFCPLCCPWELAFIAASGMKSLFTGIDSASHTVVSSAEVIYSCMPLFYLFLYFIFIANTNFFESIAWNLLSQILYSVSGFYISGHAGIFLKTEQKSSAFIRVDGA